MLLKAPQEATSAMGKSSDARLQYAIEGLYEIFARYPLPEHGSGCPCCVSDVDHALLYSKELRLLGPDDLARFTFKAMTTWGGADEFRHFLPRIFELLARTGDQHWTVGEIVFGKLEYGGWRTWPEDEQTAITTFFEEVWSNTLDRFPQPFDAGTCLCSISQAVDDLNPYLKTWGISHFVSAARHFAYFLEHEVTARPGRRWSLGNSWWRNRPKLADQVLQWLRNPVRKAELEQAFFAFGPHDQDAAVLLSNALETLSRGA